MRVACEWCIYLSLCTMLKNCKSWAVNNHWTGLLEWTTGMDYWTDLFVLKIIFMAYNEIPLPVKLHPALDQSVIVISYRTAQDHTYLNNRLEVNIMILLLLQEKAACVQLM